MAGEPPAASRSVWRWVATLLICLLMLGPGVIAAQGAGGYARTTGSEEVARRAIGELRSPYCPGLMLEVCPSGPAEALRDSIHMLAAQGMGSGELVEWMIANHGEEWRAVPKRSGLGLGAWVLPPLVLLLGAGLLAGRLRRLRRDAAPAAASAPELTAAERAELAAQLADWEREPAEPS